jgi:NAD(P)-dependent dehydrogenase (short-subunit alcohol dehydrogenase family)
MSYWNDNMDGLRWAFVASWLAAPLLIEQGGLIVNVSNKIGDPGDPAYGIAKTGTDRLTLELAHQFRSHHVAALSLYPGLVRTENILVNAQWFDMSTSEAPIFTGRAVAALAADPNIMHKSGQGFVVKELATEYSFEDEPQSA